MAQTTAHDAHGATALSSRLAPLFAAIGRRRLASALLLFAVGHRPLAFLFSQALYMAEPLCDLMGLPGSRDLAEWLSRPDGIDMIASRLLAPQINAPETNSSEACAPHDRLTAHVLE